MIERESSSLGFDPEKNITMTNLAEGEEEVGLREKADIHKVRLSKHGKSKLN